MIYVYYANLFTARDKREIFLEAVFLWKTPLLAALLISPVAASNAAAAASLSFAAIAASTFFTEVFTADLIALFLSAFLRSTKSLFLADLMFAIFTPPIVDYLIMIDVSTNKTRITLSETHLLIIGERS